MTTILNRTHTHTQVFRAARLDTTAQARIRAQFCLNREAKAQARIERVARFEGPAAAAMARAEYEADQEQRARYQQYLADAADWCELNFPDLVEGVDYVLRDDGTYRATSVGQAKYDAATGYPKNHRLWDARYSPPRRIVPKAKSPVPRPEPTHSAAQSSSPADLPLPERLDTMIARMERAYRFTAKQREIAVAIVRGCSPSGEVAVDAYALAARTGVSRVSVYAVIKKMQAGGALEVVREGDWKTKVKAIYRVAL